jgi:hypothetical protein
MKQKKKIIKNPSIQIVDPDPKLLETVKRLAEKEKRSVGRQAEVMLGQFIEIKKLG